MFSIIEKYITLLTKYVKYIKIFLITLSLSSIAIFFFPREMYKEFGTYAWYILIGVMFIRPIRDLFPKCKIFSFLSKFRRELGILVGIFAIVHTIGYIEIAQYKSIFGIFSDKYVWKYTGYLLWGMIALIISFPLLITSNGFATHILGKNWKRLQRLSYFMFIFVAIHIFMIGKDMSSLIIIILWIVTFTGAYIKNKKIKKIQTSGPKWLCVPCGYIYDVTVGDPDGGIVPGTKFEDIPNNRRCPICGVGKQDFILLKEDIKVSEAEISSLKYLTADVIELKLDVKKNLTYEKGQFLSLTFSDTNGNFERSYSIANKEGYIYTFLIKLKENGRAGMLLKTKKTGESIGYTNVSGKFTLQNTKNPKVCLATGTGLAPIYAILNGISTGIKKEVYFCVATEKDIFYKEKLEAIKDLELHLFLSKEEKVGFNYGRISLESKTFDMNTEFYICGNPSFVISMINFLKEKGYTYIYSEEFE